VPPSLCSRLMANVEAEKFKKLGNDAFSEQKWDEAIKNYNKAITLDPENAAYYSNRSGAWSSKGNHDSALADANKCLSNDPTFVKGYARKGKAYFDMDKWEEAEKSYKEGLARDPANSGCKRGIADIEAARKLRRASSRSSGFGGGGGAGGIFQGFADKMRKGGKMQTYMMMFAAYFLFNQFMGRNRRSSTSSEKHSMHEAAGDDDDAESPVLGDHVTRGFTAVDGMWLSHLQATSKSETMLLLLHRTSLSAEVEFGSAIPRLVSEAAPSGGFRVLAPDRPCHGYSPCPAGGEPERADEWLKSLAFARNAPRTLAIVASGREAARQALALARQRPGVSHIILASPRAMAPTRPKTSTAVELRDWLTKSYDKATVYETADAARWLAVSPAAEDESNTDSPPQQKGLNVAKLPKGCGVSLLYDADADEEDEALRLALEAHAVDVKVRSTSAGHSLQDIIIDEVRQSLTLADSTGPELEE